MAILTEAAPGVLLWALVSFAVAAPAIIALNVLCRIVSVQSLPRSLPWAGIGRRTTALARARANLTSIFRMKSLLNDGYNKYSKNNETYVLPHILTGAEVVLPPSQAKWLVEQPDTVLSQTEVNRQFLEADHTFLHPNIVREPVHPDVIRRELTHKLSGFADDIVDELQLCLEENWGTDTENWREVKVYDTLLDVIARLSTRVFVGDELCHNKEFQYAARMFDKNVVVSAAFLNLMPGFLKPVFAPLLTVYDYLQFRTCAKFVLPTINERLARLRSRDAEEKLPLADIKQPNDYIKWAIDHALNHWDPVELTASVIVRRLACLFFAAIQSSVISISNTLFDIAASPNCDKILLSIREEVLGEIDAASTAKDGQPRRPQPSGPSPFGKAALARMVHVDSALRESMRLNGFVARGIMKMVVARDGVVLPDGSHIPYGTKVGIQAYNVHRDEAIYADAETYDAFRFVQEDDSASVPRTGDRKRRRSAGSATGSSSGSDTDDRASGRAAGEARRRPRGRDGQPQALVTTSPTFLAFSHGPNACPGRFFAANQMKITLAHIALHYEIEPVAERPENKWFVGSMAPPMWSTLRVRRRKA